ncbi:MAG: ABC transporter ATP-binding protein [Methanothrix sp.]|nr:ABC transporter ATP-binding protein [Methanothrix sp.]
MTEVRAAVASILQIEDLSVSFDTAAGQVKAADDVSFVLHRGEALALVGETGCGKSVVASSIMQLLPRNAIIQGRAVYAGGDLLRLDELEMSRIRGSEIAIVFQNPSLALNPIIRVGEQIAEMLRIRKGAAVQALQQARAMLSGLGLRGDDKMRMYPFQFSGGMNQRVMIAASMILSPRIIIADEPSKGLDGALAGEVMAEMARIKNQSGASLLLITHDLNLARNISDRIAVMYCGEIVEIGRSEDIFNKPLHPYTSALLDCLPERGFQPIPGSSPSMINPPSGCKFLPRCPKGFERCRKKPGMVTVEGMSATFSGSESMSREVRCWLY